MNKEYKNWEEIIEDIDYRASAPTIPLPIAIKYYERMFDGINEEGLEYNVYKDLFDMIWEMLPDGYNMDYIIKYIDYPFLTEVEMMFVDMVNQSVNGAGVEFNPKNWWVWSWLQDCIYEMRRDPAFYIRLNDKSDDNYAQWTFLLDSSEIIENSIIRAKERAEKWMIESNN